jgi:hypothetical protein
VSSDRITPAPESADDTSTRTNPVDEIPSPVDTEENVVKTPGEDDATQEGEYMFERITGMRQRTDGSIQYKVRWYGYGTSDDTWVPSAHLPKDALRRYHRRTGWKSTK